MASELKESDVRPREIPSPKDSVFLADMRSHQKVFHRLAEFGKMLREPGANFLGGVENDLRSTENSQNESHLQDHLDERMTPHLSNQNNIPMCQECGRDSSKHPRRLSADQMNDDCNSTSVTPKMSNKSKSGTLSDSQIAKSVLLEGTKSKVGRLISQFQEFAKASSKQSR